MSHSLATWLNRIADGDLWGVADELERLGRERVPDSPDPGWRAPMQRMVNELIRARQAFEDYNRGLEHAVLGEIEAERDRALLAEARATAASRAKSRFLANVSHELRTPMNVIIGYTEMLMEDEPDETTSKDLRSIWLASRHLLTLIDDVLDISRIEAGQSSVELDVVNLGELTADVVAAMGPIAESNGNQLVLNQPADGTVITTDGPKVRQILLNLLGNACKFTRDGSITLVLTQDADFVWLAVADTGTGMTPEQCEQAFEEFSQVGPSTGRDNGAGLGLAISLRLSRLLGGDLTVQSHPGRGSVFTLSLPSRVRLAIGQQLSTDSPLAQPRKATLT